MNPIDVTVDQVRSEIGSIIINNPSRVGSIAVGDDEYYACVYYTDENGDAVNYDIKYGDEIPVGKEVLVNPCCLIGKWIEDFHPEFKSIESVCNILIRNVPINSKNYFSYEVGEALAAIQIRQDGGEVTWDSIDIDEILGL